MMKRPPLIIVVLFLLCIGVVSAGSVAYVVKDSSTAQQKYISLLEDIGHDVDIITDADLRNADFSGYDLIVVNDDYFTNPSSIPVNEYPSLVLNTYHLETFGWAIYAGELASSGILTAHINYPPMFITKDIPTIFNVYAKSRLSYSYIPRISKAQGLKVQAGLISDNNDALIATVEPGAKLLHNKYSNAKGVFFGFDYPQYWTQNYEKLFRNSVEWLIYDTVPPTISGIALSNVKDISAEIAFEADKDATATLYYSKDCFLGLQSLESTMASAHSFALSSLQPLTGYCYKVKVCNIDSYCNMSPNHYFSTIELIPPIFTHSITGITNNSIEFTVEADEEVNVTILYGIESMDSSAEEPSFSSVSEIELIGLLEKTTYLYEIIACDKYSNCASSDIFNFTTTDMTAPGKVMNVTAEVINGLVVISWASEEDELKFNVYTADDLEGFDFTHPEFTTQNNSYVDVVPASRKFYCIRSEDKYRNEEKNTDIIARFDRALPKGYTLVSLPVVPFDNRLDAILEKNKGYSLVSEVQRFNPLTKKYEKASYDLDTKEWDVSSFDTLEFGRGYFFYTLEDTFVPVIGTVVHSYSVEAKEGMNLLGTGSIGQDISEIFMQSPDDMKLLEVAVRHTSGKYSIATFYPEHSPEYWHNDMTLAPGKGYWVHAQKDFTFTIP
jgi:hypothetical protein